jgi:ATP-dependent DNA helicase RecG
MPITLATQLSDIKGIGANFTAKLEKLEIRTIKDLLYHFPFRYMDFSKILPVADAVEGAVATFHGTVEKVSISKTFRRKLWVITVRISDGTGKIDAVWFNQKFLISTFKEGQLVNIAGRVMSNGKKLYLSAPVFEVISSQGAMNRHTGRLVPVYPETKGVTSKLIRFALSKVMPLVKEIPEFLPESLLNAHDLPQLYEAFLNIHYPSTIEEAEQAQKRFSLQDLFLLQLLHFSERQKLSQERAVSFPYDAEQIKKWLAQLPFELTLSQKKALHEILEDLKKEHPTQRLLQGDVGSGKTVVSAIAARVVAGQGHQAVILAPTEVLALQHYDTFKKFYSAFAGEAESPLIILATASKYALFAGDGLESEISRKNAQEQISSGRAKIVIGTHAVIQKSVRFHSLGFVVIDEQHRFGVRQRAELLSRKDDDQGVFMAHLLSMSATPIPRTLAMTAFGDLDLSIISELPKGRKKIETAIVSPVKRADTYKFIRKELQKGRQAYVVCPRIEPADPDAPLSPRQLFQLEVKSVKEEYEKLSKKIFPEFRITMLHGQLKAAEKNKIMSEFKQGKLDMLVSTSVIEVGVDVPNATVMLIEGSERFGLSQLYQFRGRVGRGEHQSYCFLCTDVNSKTTNARLRALVNAKSGFELAEMDLKMRGPGQFLGEVQTGIPDIAMRAIQNPAFVLTARDQAKQLLEKDPHLAKYPYLAAYLKLFRKSVHLE